MDGSQMEEDEPTLRVLYVCTANIARSPYAERRTAQLLAGHSVQFASAGVRARGGHEMDERMAAELVARGGSSYGHMSRPVDETALKMADLIITLAYSHHMDLLQTWPQYADKIVGLRQLVLGVRDISATLGPEAITRMRRALPAASITLDVADPYGRGKKAAALCASEIDESLAVVAPFLIRATGAEAPMIQSGVDELTRSIPESKGLRRFFQGRGSQGHTK